MTTPPAGQRLYTSEEFLRALGATDLTFERLRRHGLALTPHPSVFYTEEQVRRVLEARRNARRAFRPPG